METLLTFTSRARKITHGNSENSNLTGSECFFLAGNAEEPTRVNTIHFFLNIFTNLIFAGLRFLGHQNQLCSPRTTLLSTFGFMTSQVGSQIEMKQNFVHVTKGDNAKTSYCGDLRWMLIEPRYWQQEIKASPEEILGRVLVGRNDDVVTLGCWGLSRKCCHGGVLPPALDSGGIPQTPMPVWQL